MNASTAWLNAFGASAMRPCAAPDTNTSFEPAINSASSSASPTGVSESCEPVMSSGGIARVRYVIFHTNATGSTLNPVNIFSADWRIL